MPGSHILGTVAGRTEKFTATPSLPGSTDELKLTARNFVADHNLDDKVLRILNYNMKWKLLAWDQASEEAGDTGLPLYTLKAVPLAGAELYHSVVDISCRGIAANNDEVVLGVRKAFAVNTVTRKPQSGYLVDDPVVLTYWGSMSPPQSAAGMLKHPQGHGSCVAFAELMGYCFASHGQSCEVLQLLPNPVNSNYNIGMTLMVQTWQDNGGGSNLPPAPWNHSFLTVVDVGRIAAQNNANSPSRFRNHYVTKVTGGICDPSYGDSYYPTRELHEAAAFWGYSSPLSGLTNPGVPPPPNGEYLTPDRGGDLDTTPSVHLTF